MFTWRLNLIKSISGQNTPYFAEYFLTHASINPRNSRSNRDYAGNDRQWVLLRLFEIVAKVMDLYVDSQYVRHHMAKQMLNANISPSIVFGMSAGNVYG